MRRPAGEANSLTSFGAARGRLIDSGYPVEATMLWLRDHDPLGPFVVDMLPYLQPEARKDT